MKMNLSMVTKSTALACLGLLFFVLPGCGPLTFTVGLTPADQAFTEKVVQKDSVTTVDKIAIVDINGLILNTRPRRLLSEGTNPLADFQEKLRLAAADAHVRAVILRINSPGGTVTASDAMYREVERFRKISNKPVVALMMDTATSGGYYVSLASDRIVAYPTTVTGSIGVIVQIVSLQPALQNFGITADAIVSGPNKAAGNPLAPFDKEQRQTLQDLVDDFYSRFRELVRKHRPEIPEGQFKMVTDGRVFSGEEAHALKMVDQLGDLYTAWDEAKSLADLSSANLVLYHRPMRYVGSPYSHTQTDEVMTNAGTQVNLMQVNVDGLGMPGGAGAGFWYIWRPDLP